ncbi:MAG: PspC domain-containing protein [Bacteroidales bacterium]|jgi:phage shock protein C|nr:PspC domain-containing protein [Bacteroidales bacterium]MBP5389834.1 PspC domain-containing protein [Bacteroidales bacterium]MBR0110627.1 PspC domain-containing protein [Bacteroidales bacterium]MBR0290697.1 PspC domain-containing protein [Bacteroidales bacterium]MBR6280846.1 PspC domain-containing protein [Bacteroidales bacterium]
MSAKKLYRIREGRVFAGVCSGIGEYLDVDPVIIRLLWLVLVFAFGGGILAYLIAWIIIPMNPVKLLPE